MGQYLLLVSIGPVQDFIASARRCRDLWFGSWLLSELSRTAAAAMLDGRQDRVSLVFPGGAALSSLDPAGASVSNRILVQVAGDAEAARDVAEAGKDALAARLHQIAGAAFARVGRNDPERASRFHEDVARKQVADLMEYLWVAVPEGPSGYSAARAEAERLMSARKNTRTWSVPTWSQAGVPKSSLDGARESVLDESLFDQPIVTGVRTAEVAPQKRRQLYGVHGSERLCGVGLLKRLGRSGTDSAEPVSAPGFPSTSHLAALPLVLGAGSDTDRVPELRRSFAHLREALPHGLLRDEFYLGDSADDLVFGQVDCGILFESRLREVLSDWALPQLEIEQVLERQRKVLSVAARGEPNAYYAMVVADGDSLGQVIDAQESFQAHRELSDALVAFSHDSRRIVREHQGEPIYSGGDDVLALLPLHRALTCTRALANGFREQMSEWTTRSGLGTTLSAGVAVVHHLMPLDHVRRIAREAEARAKEIEGKNALCITVARRSGTPVTIAGHWNELDRRLEKLLALRRLDAISERAGYELEALSRLTGPDPQGELDNADVAALEKVQRVEAVRVLARKRARRGAEQIAEQTLGGLRALLDQQHVSPGALGRELYVATVLARAAQQAEAPERASEENSQ